MASETTGTDDLAGGPLSDGIVPSGLDPKTHNEVCMLYAESTETLRFIKTHQWRTVGATLLTFLGMIFIAGYVEVDPALSRKFMAIVILMTCAVIFTLIIYQFWMHNEMRKLARMEKNLSSVFAEIRAIKSKKEGNLHRYTLLVFMIVVVFLGSVVFFLAIDRLTG